MKLFFFGNLYVHANPGSGFDKNIFLDSAKQIFGDHGYSLFKNKDRFELQFDADTQFSDADLEQFTKKAKENNWTVSGSIDYSGDQDGRFIIKDNEIEDMSKEACAIVDASDDILIAELEYRGYKVHSVKDKNNIKIHTPMGVLTAEKTTDTEHPGIWISLQEEASLINDGICLIEYCDAEYNAVCDPACDSHAPEESIKLRVYKQDRNGFVNEEPCAPVVYKRRKDNEEEE